MNMEKQIIIETLKKLVKEYNRLSYTHYYIFGFVDKGNVYAVKATSDILAQVCYIDKASRNGGVSLRFRPNKQQKHLLESLSFEIVCTEQELEQEAKASKYNRGEIFEKKITERVGQEWRKDHVPFTEAGDITINGVAYQIKYNRATFATEESLASLAK